jgi:hypothetical protein
VKRKGATEGVSVKRGNVEAMTTMIVPMIRRRTMKWNIVQAVQASPKIRAKKIITFCFVIRVILGRFV